jgi:DnaJ-like protein/uncharacterized protein DUF4388/tetratricopeptide repeat protein
VCAWPTSGRVNQHPFARIVGSLATRGFTGVLRLAQENRSWALWWKEGAIVAGESSSPEDTLGRVAFEAGLVDASAVAESIRLMAQTTGKRQVDALVELGALAQDAVPRAQRMTLVRRALRIFAVPNASYAIEEQSHGKVDGGPLEPRWALYRGLRQHYDEQRLDAEIVDFMGQALRLAVDAAAVQDAFGFTDEERILLAYLQKGYWELPDLVDACLTLSRAAVLAVVYGLHCFDYLDVQPAQLVPRLRKRAREATQRLPREALAPSGPSPFASAAPVVGPPPGSAPPAPPRPGSGPQPAISSPSSASASGSFHAGHAGHGGNSGSGPLKPPTVPPRAAGTPLAPPVASPRSSSTSLPRMGTPAAGTPSPGGPSPTPSGGVPSAILPSSGSSPGMPRARSPLEPLGKSGPAPAVPTRQTGRNLASQVPPGAAGAGSGGTGSGGTGSANRTSSPPLLGDASVAAVLREQIASKLKQVDGGVDHFRILEVDREATSLQVKAAYFQLAKMYHPDRLAIVKLEELRPQVERIFARLSEAFSVLSDDARRKDYLQVLAQGGEQAVRKREDAEVAKANRILSAEEHFRRGEMALRRQLFPAALEEFEEALELNPDEPEHHVMHAWAVWCNAADKQAVFTAVRRGLNKAIELSSSQCVPAFFHLGQVYKQMGDQDRAYNAFQRALSLRPTLVDAEREVRLIEMRRAKQPGKKGGGRFDAFKKK